MSTYENFTGIKSHRVLHKKNTPRTVSWRNQWWANTFFCGTLFVAKTTSFIYFEVLKIDIVRPVFPNTLGRTIPCCCLRKMLVSKCLILLSIGLMMMMPMVNKEIAVFESRRSRCQGKGGAKIVLVKNLHCNHLMYPPQKREEQGYFHHESVVEWPKQVEWDGAEPFHCRSIWDQQVKATHDVTDVACFSKVVPLGILMLLSLLVMAIAMMRHWFLAKVPRGERYASHSLCELFVVWFMVPCQKWFYGTPSYHLLYWDVSL